MAVRIAVTGSPGVGKSTLVRKVLESLGDERRVGGVLAMDRRVEGRRAGFEILDLASGARGSLAGMEGEGPRVGRYRVNLDDLERIGARALEEAVEKDLIVVDEVGPMELVSRRFISAVERAIASEKDMIVVVQERSRHPLANRIRETFRVVRITRDNRDGLVQEIAREITSSR